MNTGDSKFEAMISDPDFRKLSEDQKNQLVDEYKQHSRNIIPHPENLLQRVIRNAQGFSRGFGEAETMGLGNLAEYGADKLVDQLPFSQESKDYSLQKTNEMTRPNAPMAELIGGSLPFAHGALSLGKGIGDLFSAGNLPQDIEATKGALQDTIKLGPEKVKKSVSNLFDQFQNEFGERLQGIKGGITNHHFADALERTAEDIGAHHIEGSPGNRAMRMAQEFRNMSTENADRLFQPEEIQSQAKQILKSFGNDTMSKAKFYNHFSDMLSQNVPELSNLKSEFSPVYDIANQSKFINSGRLGRIASDKIGPEELGRLAQSEQMLGEEPGVVQKTSELSDKLGTQQNQLQKIIGRQKSLKGAIGTIGKGALLGAGGGGIYELLHHFFHE